MQEMVHSQNVVLKLMQTALEEAKCNSYVHNLRSLTSTENYLERKLLKITSKPSSIVNQDVQRKSLKIFTKFV